MGLSSEKVTGIILAGGQSRRLGRDKAVEMLEGVRIIDRVLQAMTEVCTSSIVVGDEPGREKELGLPSRILFKPDSFSDCGSLGGLYTGLSEARTQWSFAAACDMPLLCVDLIESMKDYLDDKTLDAVVPLFNSNLQPTHAFYNKTCLPFIEERLRIRRLRMDGYFENIKLEIIGEDLINRFAGGANSFLNVNTEVDLSITRTIIRGDRITDD